MKSPSDGVRGTTRLDEIKKSGEKKVKREGKGAVEKKG